MRKEREHFTPEEKVAILRRHLQRGESPRSLRSPCISVHARRWKVPLAFGKARFTDRRAGR
jgi:hypothetical protein